MIDYEKLKIASALADKLLQPASLSINITYGDIGHIYGVLNYDYNLMESKYDGVFKFTCIEHLIGRLLDLTKQNSKYSIGQEVWRLSEEDDPVSFIITDIDYESEEKYLLDDDCSWWVEEQLYATRQELIESQINHWLRMLEMPEQIRFFASQAKDVCQHESDGMMYTSYPSKNKCIKCGEFYRDIGV